MSRDGPRVAGVDPGTFSFDVCALEGGEVILERTTILFRCTRFDRYDQWIDSETGLVLRQITREPNDEPGWLGFVDLEFDPPLEAALSGAAR